MSILDPYFESLLERKAIKAVRSPWFFHPLRPLQPFTTFDRVEAMLLGVALGDALGRPQDMAPAERRAQYGERRDYLRNRQTGLALGYPSDDTQLTFWTVEHLLSNGHLNPRELGEHFMGSGQIFGVGPSIRDALDNLRRGIPWERAAHEAPESGAMPRMAALLLPYLRDPSPGLWTDAILAGMVTHNDFSSHAACVAWTRILWDLLSMLEPPSPEWWVHAWVEVASGIEGEARYATRAPRYRGWQGPVWKFVQHEVPAALEGGVTNVDEAGWFSGDYLLETVPTLLFLLAKYAQDPEEAIVRAATDTRDNDTIAALVGSAMGALYGRSAFPKRWIDGNTGWIRKGDDGVVFRLLQEVKQVFWEAD